MFTVDKKKLHSVYNSAVKLVGKFSELVIDVQENGLWLIINVDSYIKVFVPAEVKETGMFKIQQEVFTPILSLRGDTLKCTFNREQNILNVSAGTKTSLYVSFKVNKEDYELHEEGGDDSDETTNIKLKSKDVGNFRQNLGLVHFTSPDPNSHEYALVKNSEKKLELVFASTNICTRYSFKETLGSKEFEVCIPIDKFKMALALVESGLKVDVNERRILLESDNLTLTLPTLIDNTFLGYIEASEVLIGNSQLVDGYLEFKISEVQKTLASVRSISQGASLVEFKLKDENMVIALENKVGTSKDKCSVVKNTLGDVSFTIPELYIESALTMSGKISNQIKLQFGEDYRYFVIKIKGENNSFLMLGPVSEG